MACLCLLMMLFTIVISFLGIRRFMRGGKRVSVVVVGDIGRSPRMQYHSLSFAKAGFMVDLIGYSGSVPHKDIKNCKSVRLHHMLQPPTFSKIPRLAAYVIKSLWQGVSLLISLLTVPKSSFIFIQNPPGLPGMAACWLVAILQGSKFIIDWHNYGYSILALATGDAHPLVKIAHRFEKFFGRLSSGNLCVTNAMREDLEKNWNIKAVTMHDRPPALFKETSTMEQHRLMTSLSREHPQFKSKSSSSIDRNDSTVRTCLDQDGHPCLRNDRPALVVSSTSWTEDEDFGILLTALEQYEETKKRSQNDSFPDLLVVITGRGPQKQHYEEIIERKSFQHVSICTPWLAAEDYPKLLGSADLGVCLHLSSSGLDLPMKVVDMFGCGLPVCAVHFKCLPELVQHEENGMTFRDEEELTSQLQSCLRGFPKGCEKLAQFRKNLQPFREVGWDVTWTQNVLPVFT